MWNGKPVWLAAGVRTAFTKVDGGLARRDEVSLGVPVLQAMARQVAAGARPDFLFWGSVIPNLGYSNVARETWFDAGLDQTVPAATTVMACGTSIMAAIQAAGMIGTGASELAIAGGSESMTHVQAGLTPAMSDWLRHLSQAKDLKQRAQLVSQLSLSELKLFVPRVQNRTTGKSMGEHCEEMAKTWEIAREDQDASALSSHRAAVAAQERGFFDDLVLTVDDVARDAFPRRDTSAEKLAKLAPAFDKTSGKGTLTAGNSSPFTDGAAGVWIASEAGLARLPASIPRARFVDWEIAAVDIREEGLLMAPAYAIPRLLVRNGMTYADVGLWEIHEAFSAQVLCHLKALESEAFLRDKVGVTATLGGIDRERLNPNGGSVALGHPFAATGARILSQATKELASMKAGTRAVVSVCIDGGLGCVALLEAV